MSEERKPARRRWPLFARRTVWWPTGFGWLGLLGLGSALISLWFLCGETFLSPTRRLPAEVLIVEGWTGRDSLSDAVKEFREGGYSRVVTAGGSTGGDWSTSSWNYADLAAEELRRLGLPPDRVLAAPAKPSNRQRTHEAAVAVRRVLEARGNLPARVNVWTRGSHARRSRLVFAKVLAPQTRVGVVAWKRPDASGPWWESGDRSRDFFEESFGYLYERLLNSGRW